MDNKYFKRIIIKYSWILIIYYLLVSGLPKISTNLIYVMTDKWGMSPAKAGTYMLLYDGLTYLLNILIALIMYLDYKKNEIKNAWTIILTLLYIPIGICVFFINMFYSKTTE